MSKPSLLMNRQQVMKALGVSSSTLRRKIDAGEFPPPALILGRQRWKVDDFEWYVNRQFRIARNQPLGHEEEVDNDTED